MLGWLRASCPVDWAAKNWIEDRLQWLAEQFDSSAFTDKPVVLPTPEFFPDPYDGSRRSIRRLFERVCDYMGVAPGLVTLRFFSEARNLLFVNDQGKPVPDGAAGWYGEGTGKFIVRLETSQAADPMALVATMAHELAHVRLLGEGRIDNDAYDNELLTDLTALFHGLGIFLANSPRNWDGQYAYWPGTELRKPEYMTPPMFGYALAHLAWHRNQSAPSWCKYLRWSARINLKHGLRYLEQTGDSRFKPGQLGIST